MKFNEILIKYRELRRIKLTNTIKESILQFKAYFIILFASLVVAALLYFYSIHTNSTNIALLALAIIFLAFMPMSYLRRPFWESDEIQSCNKNLTDNMKEFLIEKACFSKSQLGILIKQYNLDYSNESKASLMSTEKFPPIFTLLITPFTICVTTFLAQQKDYVVYAFLFGGIYYAVLCIIFMIFQCIDPFINKENYLAKDLVLLLLDFELELPTSNKEPEDNIQQIKHERIEQGENQ